jgi:hypothetical protein
MIRLDGRFLGILKDLEAKGRAYLNVLSLHLSGGSDENHDKPVMIVGISVEIWKGQLSNTSQNSYGFNQFARSLMTKLYLLENLCILQFDDAQRTSNELQRMRD